ncbi:MAG: 2-hydroxyacyl-CoA dehydratase [Bacillota bacterium]
MPAVGITTTVPVEVIYAAGWTPVDLNNLFITAPDPCRLVEEAERAGYPRNICAWIKGIYGVTMAHPEIEHVVAVTQGDCSNTHALMETLELAGRKIIPFAYPFDGDPDLLRMQIEKLMAAFGVSWPEVLETKRRLDRVRQLVWRVDELTWRENRVGGWDNHYYQVCCSDFNGDPETFAAEVAAFLARAEAAGRREGEVRLGYIGVPPIMGDLYAYLEERGARVVYNETQRQFSMPFATGDLVEQYRFYTYPYGIFYRLQDIERELERREVRGVIHYAQSFCYRQIEDIIIRRRLRVPVLTIEGDRPGWLDERTRIRLDAFVELLR